MRVCAAFGNPRSIIWSRIDSQSGTSRQIRGSLTMKRGASEKSSLRAATRRCLNDAAISEANQECGNSDTSCHEEPADARISS